VVESERGVVMSERRRSVEDDNHSLMWEQLQAAAFTAHPYSWPVIGWRSDIENWRQEDVEEFFQKWYTPNNAVLVVCGAFEAGAIIPMLEATVGAVASREIPRGVVTVEPPQAGERRVVLRKEASSGSVLVGWHVPETAHPDMRVLELIDVLLSRGESSRLYRRLVDRDQVALWVWSGTDHNFDPGLFQILVQNREGVDGPGVEEILHDEIDRLAVDPVPPRELEKAKNVLLAEFYRDMATISGRAHALGQHEVFRGGYRGLFEIASTYDAVTSEDIARVAREYFVADNRTTVTLVPEDASEVDHEN
jgi:zinc protease